MDRCALFVDAGYLLADGAMAVHGTRHRETVSWDFGGLLQLLSNLSRERTGLPLLRCYWYEATVEGRRSPEHDALADLPGLKLRLGRIRPGRREGVDTEIHRDLMALARNGALADAVVVSGDEDLAQVVADAQDLGVRVTVVHVAVDGNWTISRVLRQECDDLIEIGTGHLRPFVNLLAGYDTGTSALPGIPSPLSNGHGTSTTGSLGQLQSGPHAAPPPSSPITGQPQLPSGTPAGSGIGSGMGAGTGVTGASGLGGASGMTGNPGMTGSGMTGSGLTGASGMNSGSGMTGNSGMGTGSGMGQGLGSGSGMGAGSGLGGTSGISGLTGLGSSSGLGQSPGSNGPSTSSSNSIHAAPTPSATPPSTPITGPQYSTPSPTPAPPPSPPHGPYTGPQQIAPLPVQQQNAPTLSDAVKAAHQEGQDFGESVARDAPALWLEAVLARKPRMPSDLEARLLQGSSLPIDFLLHDEVRHALRRGFWDALERSRR
ncbi:NYN domain-containing protein [Actinomadura barringtoniae]|uniref:NYN domain-containing protein n=1 Tax=Actinomadura barringtoniae TaxID=1427535 RepID=A0A939PFM7_9ACTN|nr:NYN domain-containing protein [Actinomadura barringtoniae]MBO2449223.1 NYN domain-containing protein [Actinomadura barringtoniae]